MKGNITATSHTYLVDLMYKYITKYLKDVMFMIMLMKSAENDGNILIVNLHGEVNGKHATKMIGDKAQYFGISKDKRKIDKYDVFFIKC